MKFSFSELGQYCDKRQQCYGDLQCCSNTCQPSDKCKQTKCKNIQDCPDGSYLVPRDGYDICCNYCQKYAGE